MQPMTQGSLTWICNGELYNWKEVADRHSLLCLSDSDCSVIGPLWAKFRDTPDTFFRALDGVFAIVIVDEDTGFTTVGRDPYGVRPLFYKKGKDGSVQVASEMKAFIVQEGDVILPFKPGSYKQFKTATGEQVAVSMYHTVPWLKNPTLKLEDALRLVRETLIAAVKKRLMTERPVAALLSGGLDSSLIAALVQRELKGLGLGPLETFTVGFEGSPDVFHARQVAEWIGSKHVEIIVTPEEFFAVIPEVIRDIESYDITTVRASVGNWFVSREIRRRSSAKVIFNGDGADELFGSYLYCFRAPDDESYEHEVGRLLRNIHRYDVLRSDRSISSHGLEPRTPFLDKQFVALAKSIPTALIRPIQGQQPEKWLLRKAFEDGLLPDAVLWRQKEAFSDGVSGSKPWFKEIQERVVLMDRPLRVYTHLPPPSSEAQYYRDLFESFYGDEGASVITYFWMPKWTHAKDPSATTLSFYTAQL
jgi:asparagine synthase (glutamine-hydrolysing)